MKFPENQILIMIMDKMIEDVKRAAERRICDGDTYFGDAFEFCRSPDGEYYWSYCQLNAAGDEEVDKTAPMTYEEETAMRHLTDARVAINAMPR